MSLLYPIFVLNNFCFAKLYDFPLQIQRGVIVIPASRNKQRCKENIDIFGFILDDDDMKMINKMNLNRRLYVPIVDGKPWCSDHPHYPFNIEY